MDRLRICIGLLLCCLGCNSEQSEPTEQVSSPSSRTGSHLRGLPTTAPTAPTTPTALTAPTTPTTPSAVPILAGPKLNLLLQRPYGGTANVTAMETKTAVVSSGMVNGASAAILEVYYALNAPRNGALGTTCSYVYYVYDAEKQTFGDIVLGAGEVYGIHQKCFATGGCFDCEESFSATLKKRGFTGRIPGEPQLEKLEDEEPLSKREAARLEKAKERGTFCGMPGVAPPMSSSSDWTLCPNGRRCCP